MLRKKFENTKIILASGSPRRQEFFKNLDLDFEVRLKEIEEIFPKTLQSLEITDYLAKLKASAFDGDLLQNELLVTSDTLVWLQNEALGKPKDYDDAFAMLQKLSNQTHEVITSVCFKTKNKTEIINDITQVTFGKLSDEAIKYYLDNYKPFDKAGSYGIQEWIGLIGITNIHGSYTNVVGLPTEKVYLYLLNHTF
ncbi:septum formation inhibitor Maf [Flavobacterium psychrophilum]|uniref:dTTP/UTP pyrophosphatase n=1 Tax=Flavobacterium psychrophilum (strain ATCC 49511 / DSM 21280 / CIP 103535 / JIP02/86) TaxID=402612 RepID=NTPPA_FLAPJ|nr:Maf-like protein [Flavobacterium psychrophilum]A6GZH5.1 RecName: Full=dTTP/UTP pyrophosphatase; Short=dTTPase/UTPase; AltName: Full=Nucleoside triphosphate pyrophosphatase; AltName: Full=Nucleotide pyrophosphatase; Short=Nucleotide PPase [Flavobacterium psychrophilum JIP02/86]AIG30201.1 septum formation inhibitor Maf [Flavobacterium psychrophilum]AIG32476.1 septum formation inhibitor Maf [Flavobacterium psychrophilum]AIG34632.1 septum formation inhibitor Maf [Flavobacterium psychrophilum]AI